MIVFVNGNNVLASSANNVSGSPYTSSSYTPSSDSNVIVIFVQGYNSLGSATASISSITWGGVSIAANEEAFQNATTRAWSAVFVVPNPGTTAKTVQVAISVDQRAMQIDILEFSGVNSIAPVVSTAKVGGTATTDTLDFTVATSGNAIVGSFSVDGGAEVPFTPDSGTIEVTDQATGGTNFNDNSVSSMYKITATSGTQSIGTTWVSSAAFSATGVELAEDSSPSISLPSVKISGTFTSSGSVKVKESGSFTEIAAYKFKVSGSFVDIS